MAVQFNPAGTRVATITDSFLLTVVDATDGSRDYASKPSSSSLRISDIFP